jgi:hypothetical protein
MVDGMLKRGINYDVGTRTGPYLSRLTFDVAQTRHDLTAIRDELHCDAVRISGTAQDRLLTAAELALDLGLEVWLSPHLHDGDPVQIERVDWSVFDFVCLDYYRGKRNRHDYGARLQRHFTHGKPVIITEVGCCTYRVPKTRAAWAGPSSTQTTPSTYPARSSATSACRPPR